MKEEWKSNLGFWLGVTNTIVITLGFGLPLYTEGCIENPKLEQSTKLKVAYFGYGLVKLWVMEYARFNTEVDPYYDKVKSLACLQPLADELDLKIDIEKILDKDIQGRERNYFVELPPPVFYNRINQVLGDEYQEISIIAGYLADLEFRPYKIEVIPIETNVEGSIGAQLDWERFKSSTVYPYCSREINEAFNRLKIDFSLPKAIPNMPEYNLAIGQATSAFLNKLGK